MMHTFCLLLFFHSVLFVYSHTLPKTSSSMSILTMMGYQDNNGTTVAHFQYHASPVDLDDVDINSPPHKHHLQQQQHQHQHRGLTDRVKKTLQDVRLALKEDSVRLVSGTRQPLSLQEYYRSLRLAKEKKDVPACPKGALICPRAQLSPQDSSLPTADDLSTESLRPIVVDGIHSKTAAKLLSIRGGAGKSGTMIKGAKVSLISLLLTIFH